MAPRRGRKYWYRLVEECEASAQSQAAFARSRGVAVGTLRHWVYRYRKEVDGFEVGGAAAVGGRLVEVAVGSSRGAEAPVRLVLGEVVWLELSGLPPVEYLVELAQGLERPSW